MVLFGYLNAGPKKGLFFLLVDIVGAYLNFGFTPEQGGGVGIETYPCDFLLESATEEADTYRITPAYATDLTIRKSTDSNRLVLQRKSDQPPGADVWSFVKVN